MLDEIAALSYPAWLSKSAPYLPEIDLTCVATSGMSFLNEAIASSTSATITGFMNAIKDGCSKNPMALVLTGGYDHAREELEINIIVDLNAARNL